MKRLFEHKTAKLFILWSSKWGGGRRGAVGSTLANFPQNNARAEQSSWTGYCCTLIRWLDFQDLDWLLLHPH